VGVDVEKIRPLDAEVVAERFFSVPEREALREVPPPCRLDAFFTCWTRKEAYVKALGAGLGYPLDGFAVTVVPGAPARMWSTGPDQREIGRWSVAALEAAPGYVAAVVVEGHGWRLSNAPWPPR
jgi:4'-phosphopantetheinyl transferase